ncbi:MAG TPA: DUF4810 domain-containing protein [Dehalococcoidia bacterium]
MKKYFIAIALLSLVLSGCTQGMYKWNGYDDAMYQYYKSPVEKEAFMENLAKIIALGEGTNNVPPGIYAEYGFLHYEGGNFAEAINYFQKEHDRWPESRIFISKMIRNAKMALERSAGTARDINVGPAVGVGANGELIEVPQQGDL